MRRRLLAHAIAVGALLLIAATARAGDETCEYYTPNPPHEPTGIKGCTLDGPTDGIASTYPGDVAAANWCEWPWTNCGSVIVQSHDTGLTITVPVGMYCDCYFTTVHERLIDLTPGQVLALGLDPARGLFPVTVTPIRERESSIVLPDTAYTSMVGVATNTDTMRAARVGATPPARAARHSGVDE